MDHPVGTGPYRIKDWRHGQKVVLEANPDYREDFFPEAPSNADYYMQQFYGPSAGAANLARFRNSDFDTLFRQSRHVADPEERTNVYAKMTDIIAAYNPWCPKAFRISNTAIAP